MPILPETPINETELKRSLALTEVIRARIATEGGKISFSTFMQLALYHPELGYYNDKEFSIGKAGDFTTAPEISPLFAQCVAQQIMQVDELFGDGNILEIGAGSGRFAHDLLTILEQCGHAPGRYYIYEISRGLRAKQQDFLRTNCPDFLHNIVWLDELPLSFSGIVIANEVLDAIPVDCFMVTNDSIQERFVTWQNERFQWETAPTKRANFAAKTAEIMQEYPLADQYQSELNLSFYEFLPNIVKMLAQGIILFADYGYGRKEYYHPARQQGTLTCFYQHKQGHDPLLYPGLQDITSHVDFTRVIEIASDYDCDLCGYTTQAAFMLGCGLEEIVSTAERTMTSTEALNMHTAVKILTFPTEMGERVKVMCLGKNIEVPLIGFSLQDRRRDL